MRKLGLILLALLVTCSFAFAGGASETQAVTVTAAPVSTQTTATDTSASTTTDVPEEFHIGIVTGTVSQSEDDLRGAEALIAEYGSVDEGGMIQHLTYPDNFYEKGVDVTTYHGERFLPTCKTSNLLLSYLALNDAHSKGAFEALLVDRQNQVLEGTRSNFYMIRDNTLYSAPDELILSGVTRISVLRAAKELGLTVSFTPVRLDELWSSGTMFLSSTSMAAMPISAVDGRTVPCDIPLVLKIRDLVRLWEAE